MFISFVRALRASNINLLAMLASAAVVIALSDSVAAQNEFDVSSVPHPEGAIVVEDRKSSSSISYAYPGNRAAAAQAVEQALNAQGWLRYRTPDQPKSDRFKKGRLGIYVSYTMSGPKGERSQIHYSHNNSMSAIVPFPEDATEIVFDEQRPYLSCFSKMPVEVLLEQFTKGLAEEGWAALDAATIASRFPHAKPDPEIAGGARVYFHRGARDRQWPPVRLTLQRSAEGVTSVELRTAPFARPQELEFYKEFAGLPASKNYKQTGAEGSEDSPRREATALVIAEIPVVLAFYRRELTSRGYKEQEAGASISDGAVKVTFTKPDETALLELHQHYDLTKVRLVAQLTQAALAARARAKKEADANWLRDARRQADDLIAASEAKRLATAAALSAAPVETLRPLPKSETPIPLPENATSVQFNGKDGKLEFTSPSTPKSVAGFYRSELKAAGWKEVRTPIDNPTMVRLEFTKAAKKVSMTVMLFGGTARVSADGTGLQVPADPNRETEQLEGEDVSGFPVPKKRTASAPGAWTQKGKSAAFRRDYYAQVPSDIGSVLAFYRRELAKRNWKEQPNGASIKPDNVALAFVSPDGPATLKLGRKGKETTITIVVKNPEEAAKAGILPAAGRAKIILGNLDDADASIVIDQKTFKVTAGTGSSKTPDGPMLDVKPGKYKYVLKRAGKPNQSGEVIVGADDAWGLMIGPGGVLELQIY